ncbi:hypothetical protein, partial [Hydrogenophaga sp.]|uniref:hypothetical protein n=1 Tax=Hydrogenophaga sp. TaxID=1904254 RepID=UPI002731F399
ESLNGSMRPHGGSPSIESTQSAQCRPKKMHRTDYSNSLGLKSDGLLGREARLQTTVSDIEALISQLNTSENKPLVDRIQMNWGVLEELYSVDVVYPHRRVLLEHQGQLDQAARNMKALATDALNRAGYGLQPGDEEDEEVGE